MNINDETFDFIIERLTKLLIEQEFKDKKNGKATYIKKSDCFKNLIKLFKEMRGMFND